MSNQQKSHIEFSGIKDPDLIQRDIATQCTNLLSIPIRPYIQVSHFEGKNVLVVQIKEAPDSEKPVFIQSLGLEKGAFRRIGSTNQRCRRQDLRDLFRSEDRLHYDEIQLKEASFKDFDPEAIKEYRRLRSIVKPTAVELKYNNIDLLKSLRAITTIDGVSHPTVAGILLFGKEMIRRMYFPLVNQIDYMISSTQDLLSGYKSIEFNEPFITSIPKFLKIL